MRVALYHNILWSKYKGVVFSEVHVGGRGKGIVPSFIQIAETEEIRRGLPAVDLSYHRYPFRLLFRGEYGAPPLVMRIAALLRDLCRNPCDLVIMPGYHRVEYWAMLLACILLRRKRAVFCDSTSMDRPKVLWREMAKRWFFRRCDGFFCYGTRSKEYIMGYGVNAAKITDQCQAAALPVDYDPARVLRHYENDMQRGAAVRFIYVGRFSPEKGLNDLLNAFCAVRETLPGARLDLVGAGQLAEELINRVTHLGLQHAVAFLGSKPINEIAVLLMNSTALVLPSHSEPWGLVINESLSYGCPVVASSACGCVPDLVLDGATGYSFEAGNCAAMAAAMRKAADLAKDRLGVARKCLDLIAAHTPEKAASKILEGCSRIAGET